jgi:mRNA interferase RelE/StbE
VPFVVPKGSGRQAQEYAELLQNQAACQGVRLVYEVIDNRLIVLVLGVGRRDDNAVYIAAQKRVH